MYIMAFESSCDETSVSIVKNGIEEIATSLVTQMYTHASYGGVVPEIASRMHVESITLVIEDVLKKANMKMEDIDAFAVTYGPGLIGSLLVGLLAAKTCSFVYNKPLIKVNHMAGHIYANNLVKKMQFPLLALIVSGGHTDMVIMKDDYEFEILGSTLDDSIGEVYDKVARVLGLKYPGGPNVEKMALNGSCTYNLPKPVNDNTYNFSFSGLKSAVINLVHNEEQRNNQIRKEDLACSFQTIAVDELTRKVELALKNTGIKNMIVAGGVSANKYLRNQIQELCNKYNVDLTVPNLVYCTDNAAMIGAAAYPLYLKKEFSKLDINASSQSQLH